MLTNFLRAAWETSKNNKLATLQLGAVGMLVIETLGGGFGASPFGWLFPALGDPFAFLTLLALIPVAGFFMHGLIGALARWGQAKNPPSP